MRLSRPVLPLLLATLLLAGCTQPEESTPPDTPDDPALDRLLSPTPIDDPTNVTPETIPVPPRSDAPASAPTPAVTPTPATPTPPAPTPTAPTPSTPPPSPTTPPSPTPTSPSPPPPTPTSPTTPTPPPPTTWPREGSFVRYSADSSRSSYDGGYSQKDRATVVWTYTDGDWTGTCTVQTEEFVDGRGWRNGTSTHAFSAASPPHWPPMNTRSPPAEGEPVGVTYLDGCTIAQDSMPYAGTDTQSTTQDGRTVQADTHVASFSNENGDFRTEWSRTQGLVLTWSHTRMGGTMVMSFRGGLTDTDAPLS